MLLLRVFAFGVETAVAGRCADTSGRKSLSFEEMSTYIVHVVVVPNQYFICVVCRRLLSPCGIICCIRNVISCWVTQWNSRWKWMWLGIVLQRVHQYCYLYCWWWSVISTFMQFKCVFGGLVVFFLRAPNQHCSVHVVCHRIDLCLQCITQEYVMHTSSWDCKVGKATTSGQCGMGPAIFI